ncbi:MAG: HAMP domain-containing protein [Spirochaetes bacterium]|nr:HAMP domain-containing protein [Spirochaetota bacterium]
MKLRTKLILFVFGTVFIPVLVSGLIGFYLHKRREWVPSPGRIDRLLSEFEKTIVNTQRNPDFASIELPKMLTVWVFDSDDTLIFKTGGHTGDRSAGDRNMGTSGTFDVSLLKSGMFLVHPVTRDDGSEARVVLRFPPDPERDGNKRPPFYAKFLERGMWWIFALILFSAVMITVIMRSFNRSIKKLERATRRVANGDLDFELVPEGKDEIASLARSFESMRRNLKESLARRSRFLVGVSHDLKTPLTSIKGYLEAISDGLADDHEKLVRYLSIIGEKSKLLEDRIGELIDYVNMETGEWRLNKETLPLSELFEEIAGMYGEDAPVFGRTFRYHDEIGEPVTVSADRALLLRCFENLFDNAIRYTREGDTIALRARRDDGGIVVTFEDSGPGLRMEERDRVFEPFYRGSGSRREDGLGLGLSIVKSIVDAHRWRISVESEPGASTSFSIHIPEVKRQTS